MLRNSFLTKGNGMAFVSEWPYNWTGRGIGNNGLKISQCHQPIIKAFGFSPSLQRHIHHLSPIIRNLVHLKDQDEIMKSEDKGFK